MIWKARRNEYVTIMLHMEYCVTHDCPWLSAGWRRNCLKDLLDKWQVATWFFFAAVTCTIFGLLSEAIR